jgi:Metal binding domain of Ada
MRHVTKAFFLAFLLCLPIAAQQPVRYGPIIGNKSNKIYYRPDCQGYSKVSERNKVYFKTEAEAEKAGYKRAANCSRAFR